MDPITLGALVVLAYIGHRYQKAQMQPEVEVYRLDGLSSGAVWILYRIWETPGVNLVQMYEIRAAGILEWVSTIRETIQPAYHLNEIASRGKAGDGQALSDLGAYGQGIEGTQTRIA